MFITEFKNRIVVDYIEFDLKFVIALCTFTSFIGTFAYLIFCSPTDEEIIRRKRKKEILDFNKSFVTDLEKLDERDLSGEELEAFKNIVLTSATPYGTVLMSYNKDTESYWYYADNKNIPYMTLDTVAREYAVKYDCKILCVNYKEEWEKSKAAALESKKEGKKKEKEGKNEEKSEQNVFANFKTYNTKNRTDSIKRRRYRIMTDKSNQFSYKGKLREWKEQCSTKKCGNKKKITFSQFKDKQL